MAPSVKCESCGKTLIISDDVYQRRIVGHIVQVRCKNCNASIRIDGRGPQSNDPGEEEDAEQLAPDADEGGLAKPEGLPEAPDVWAVDFDEKGHRELKPEQIQAALAEGTITGATLVWTVGMDNWVPISRVAPLAAMVPGGAGVVAGARGQQPTLSGFGEFGDPRARDAAEKASKGTGSTLLGIEEGGKPRPGLGARGKSSNGEVSARRTLLGIAQAGAANQPALSDPFETEPSEVTDWESAAELLGDDALEDDADSLLDELDEAEATQIYDPDSLGHAPGAPVGVSSGAVASPMSAAQGLARQSAPLPSNAVAAQSLAHPLVAGPVAGVGPAAAGFPLAAQSAPFPVGPVSQPFAQGPLSAPGAAPMSANAFMRGPGAGPAVARHPGAFAAHALDADLERIAQATADEKSRAPLFVALAAVAAVGIGLAVVKASSRPEVKPMVSSPAPTVERERPLRHTDGENETAGAAPATAGTASDDFAKAFKAGAGLASTALSATPGSASTFDPSRALDALREASPRARACYRVGGPTRAELVLKFQPSGRATQVRATGELAGTPTGMCLVSAFTGLEIASFQGAAQEVRGDVALQ